MKVLKSLWPLFSNGCSFFQSEVRDLRGNLISQGLLLTLIEANVHSDFGTCLSLPLIVFEFVLAIFCLPIMFCSVD